MDKHGDPLDQRLESLGDLLRSQPSVMQRAMQAVEEMPTVTRRRSILFMPTVARSGIGLAACLLVGAFLWFCLAGPANITLADVQKSIDSKPWVLIRYDDGSQEWANLRERRSFSTHADPDGRNFYAGMRDHVQGIWRFYHSNWGRQIHEQTFAPRPYPQTPWEYAVGDWDDYGKIQFSSTSVEKFSDTIKGRQVVRFDTYDVGPLGLRVLAQQVWADPETRLPVRIRKYSGPDRGDESTTGDFSFPETGPSSIHDLGAPQGLPVVVNWGVIEPAAKVVVEAAKQALRQLPQSMRIIQKSKYGLSISYRLGNKFRSESYGKTNAEHNDPLVLEFPADNEQICQWASGHLTLFKVCIYDGQYEYTYDTGEGLWDSSTPPGAMLGVRWRGGDGIEALLPIREQWPFTDNVGPMKVLENEPGTAQGYVWLRYEGLNLRRDWCLDPARDYICVKQLEFSKRDDQWVEDEHRQTERADLTRLPSGQWYARSVRWPGIVAAPREFDVKVLTEAEMEQVAGADGFADFFSGENLLKRASARGAAVTFWAR